MARLVCVCAWCRSSRGSVGLPLVCAPLGCPGTRLCSRRSPGRSPLACLFHVATARAAHVGDAYARRKMGTRRCSRLGAARRTTRVARLGSPLASRGGAHVALEVAWLASPGCSPRAPRRTWLASADRRCRQRSPGSPHPLASRPAPGSCGSPQSIATGASARVARLASSLALGAAAHVARLCRSPLAPALAWLASPHC